MTKDQKITLYVFVLAVLMIVWKIYVLYSGQRLYGYIVPPGDDPLNHLEMVRNVLAGKFDTTYPPLFHIIIAAFSLLLRNDPLSVMNWFTPLLVLLPPIAVYFFLSKNFSRLAAIIGFTITILASNYGLVAYGDGNYPNILAAGFFLPMALTYFTDAFRHNARRNIIIGLIFILLTVLTHHLTTALFFAIFIVYLLVLIIWNRFEKITARLNKVVFALSGCLVIAIVVLSLTPAKIMFIQAFNSLRSTDSVLSTDAFAQILTLNETSQMLGEFAFYLGLAGLFYLMIMLARPKERLNKPAIVLVIVWFFVIFGLSRVEFVSLPARIGREVGIPLLIAGAIMIADLVSVLKKPKSRIIVLGIFGLFTTLWLVQINAGSYLAPSFFNKMIWFSAQDKIKTDFVVNELPFDTKILSNPASVYLPHFSQEKIVPVKANDSAQLEQIIAVSKADYLMVFNAAQSNPFPDRAKENNDTKAQINSYALKNKLKVFRTFADGSVIYRLPARAL